MSPTKAVKYVPPSKKIIQKKLVAKFQDGSWLPHMPEVRVIMNKTNPMSLKIAKDTGLAKNEKNFQRESSMQACRLFGLGCVAKYPINKKETIIAAPPPNVYSQTGDRKSVV